MGANNKQKQFQTALHELQIKQLPQLSHGVLRAGDAVADGARVLEDLVVVAALVRLVAEEVHGAVLDAAELLLGLDVLQAVRLVPAGGEDVEGDLAADRVAVVREVGVSGWFVELVYRLFLRFDVRGGWGVYTYVRPKSGNCSLIACTNFSRILCSRSNFS